MRSTPAALILLAACGACGRTKGVSEGEGAPATLTSTAPATLPSNATSTSPATSTETPTAPPTETPTPTASAPSPDPRKGTYVLHFGDSFTDAFFQQNLRPHFKAVGARYQVLSKTPSYTTTWVSDPQLEKLLWNKPQLVLITLGANEVDITVPNQHAGAVRALAKKASRWGACVWISPPMWKETKFLDVIKANCAPCLYFDSDAHAPGIERQRDKIHPNAVGGAKWAEAFWAWLEARRDPTQGAWVLEPEEEQAATP